MPSSCLATYRASVSTIAKLSMSFFAYHSGNNSSDESKESGKSEASHQNKPHDAHIPQLAQNQPQDADDAEDHPEGACDHSYSGCCPGVFVVAVVWSVDRQVRDLSAKLFAVA